MAWDLHMHMENGDLSSHYLALYRKAASRAGLEGYGISEHLHNLAEGPALLMRDMPPGMKAMGWGTAEYIGLVRGSGARVGLEADYIPESENELRGYLLTHDFDYCIGSVHWLGDWPLDFSLELWEGRDVEEAWRSYFNLAVKAVSTGMFDIFAHPDVVKVLGVKPGGSFDDELICLYKGLAAAAASSGTCLEVSSAGLRKRCGELYPDARLLREARLAGADISLASDAHYPEHVGYRFDLLADFAKSAGYDRAATFSGRAKSMAKL